MNKQSHTGLNEGRSPSGGADRARPERPLPGDKSRGYVGVSACDFTGTSACDYAEASTELPKLTFVIPCFNEASVLDSFWQEVCAVCDEALSGRIRPSFVFVDDGSTDGTLGWLKALARRDDRVTYLSLSRNFGKESAIYAGLRQAVKTSSGNDFVVVLDADLQDPPSLVPLMLDTLTAEQSDIVRTRRADRKGEPRVRSFFAKRFYKVINRISDTEIADGARDFQLMKVAVARAILSMEEYNRFSKGITSWVGFKTSWLEYENVERASGKTKWSFVGLTTYAMQGISAFSTTPLLISSFIGFVCFILAIALIVFIIIRTAAFGDPVAGWPSTICIILLIGGIQLFCIGILGNYVAKTYLESKRRPLYFVAETNADEELSE